MKAFKALRVNAGVPEDYILESTVIFSCINDFHGDVIC